MILVKHRRELLPSGLLFAAVVVVAFRLWTSFCFFPLADWNTIRLAPSFMLRSDQTPYPALGGGALTTWIYGPVPLFVNLPATLATNTATALVIADIINLLWTVVPLAVVIGATAATRPGTSRTERGFAYLLCLALWPNNGLQYIQADNIAIAFGLLSNVVLVRTRGEASASLLVAALCAALAIWSKQTIVGLALAQMLWLNVAVGTKTAVRYAAVCAAFGLALGGIFAGCFGLEALWLNLVTIPGRIPFCSDFAERTHAQWMQLAGYVFLPAVGAILFRRIVWTRGSVWLLPVLTWLCLLPMSVVSLYKIGGTSNSLNGVIFLLAPAALAFMSFVRRKAPRASLAWAAAVIIALTLEQLAYAPGLPVRPLTGHLRQADMLAQKFPDQIYFPWNTLVTYFTDHRFYHAEDGIYTRHIAKLGISAEMILQNMPPRWSMTAIPGWRNDDVFKQLQPSSPQRLSFGEWTLYPTSPPERRVPLLQDAAQRKDR